MINNRKNQQSHWNKLHQKGNLDEYSHSPTDFAQEVIKFFPKKAKVLELGCGLGNDAIFFSRKGFSVLATDFSNEAIKQNKKRYLNIPNLEFEILDIGRALPKKDGEFAVVYARLSLQYFTDSITKKIFRETKRILKPNGLLCFICRSTSDPLYGKGDRIENDMYVYKGHVRHFFSEKYANECLNEGFEIKIMEKVFGKLFGEQSAFIKVVARKVYAN